MRYLILIWVVGCSGLPQQAPNNHSPTAAAYPTPLIAVGGTTKPVGLTPSPVVEGKEAITPPSVPSATSPIKHIIELERIEILNNAPDKAISQGVLALFEQVRPCSNCRNYLFNLTTGTAFFISRDLESHLSCGPVSPNRDRLVCYTEDQLFILDNHGRVMKSAPWNKNWYVLLGWLDNERITLMKNEPPLSSTIIYYPFDRKEIEIPPNYPNISNLEPFNNIGNFSATAAFYNPTLEYVVYPSLDKMNIVWSRTKKQVIAEIPLGAFNPYPQWSPDGQQVVLAGKRNRIGLHEDEETRAMDVYLVTQSGDIKQATNLTASFSNPSPFDLSWSPDGRLIAFQLYTDDPSCSSRCIMILDPATLKLQGFQFAPGIVSEASKDPEYSLTWSPNSRQLLLEVFQEGNPDSTFLIILDIYDHYAYQVAKDVRILGWMRSDP